MDGKLKGFAGGMRNGLRAEKSECPLCSPRPVAGKAGVLALSDSQCPI